MISRPCPGVLLLNYYTSEFTVLGDNPFLEIITFKGQIVFLTNIPIHHLKKCPPYLYSLIKV